MALWNLKRLAPRVLIASWAPPHVPGPGHVNPRENAEAWRRLEEVLLGEMAGFWGNPPAK
jgi:hypothetical protein